MVGRGKWLTGEDTARVTSCSGRLCLTKSFRFYLVYSHSLPFDCVLSHKACLLERARSIIRMARALSLSFYLASLLRNGMRRGQLAHSTCCTAFCQDEIKDDGQGIRRRASGREREKERETNVKLLRFPKPDNDKSNGKRERTEE